MGYIEEEIAAAAKITNYKDKKNTHQVFQVEFPEDYISTVANKVDEIALPREEFQNVVMEVITILNSFARKPYVLFANKDLWFDRKTAGLFPQFDKVKLLDGVELPQFKTQGRPLDNFTGWDFEGFHFDVMTANECSKSFTTVKDNPYLDNDGKFRGFTSNIKKAIMARKGSSAVCIDTGNMQRSCVNSKQSVTLVPIFRLQGVDSRSMEHGNAAKAWLHYGLIPQNVSDDVAKAILFINNAYSHLESYFIGTKALKFNWENFWSDVDNGVLDIKPIICEWKIFNNRKNAIREPDEATFYNSDADIQRAIEYLVNCDNIRANLQPYDHKILKDINKGHWELYEPVDDNAENIATLPEDDPFYARPPQMDVHGGICAIDFGTKSTVAVLQKGTEERLMRVGQGDYTQALRKEDYENPTVIELRDYVSFHREYMERKGRPFTKWEQARFSHEAAEVLKDAEADTSIDSSVFYSIFSELKQWANDKERRMKLKDRQGNVVDLNPYLELGEEDFDPIELYAYYLGLYINNMWNGICLEYMLSFPVTYEQAVQERILESFKKGIKKSLPIAILEDKELMEDFQVRAGASEPAAYASCALGKLGLQPRAGEKTAYAVFDFGGGTTDFDFGVETVPENKRSKFIIEQFASAGRGDPYLGGENLLHMLAYEVYKENFTQMREAQIPFVLPYGGKPFAGCDPLVTNTKNATQEAYVNTKRMVEKLRPYWEGTDDKEMFQDDITISLNSNKENKTVDVKLEVNEENLENLLREKIRTGIENFFEARKDAFLGKEIYPIHILLAGNSCKSPIVKELFDKKIKEEEQLIREKIAENTGSQKDIPEIFILHLPLGAEENQEMELSENEEKTAEKDSVEESISMNFDQKATGKTGVAFGLLRSRMGGRDVRIKGVKMEAPFPFYLGEIDDEDHFRVLVGVDVPYKKWMPFTFADVPIFELYFTKEARANKGDMLRSEVKVTRCKLSEADIEPYMDDDDAHIFIRKVSPDTIEYAAGKDSDFAAETLSDKVTIYSRTITQGD
ncbi:hypothetical protein [uncultured Anaerovibrio sp.]|uniref:hypothetical protein n=1 Tax=uncultured Anaerovibrio sp. TaxID=361586 RepID=UPI0025D23BFD|nr:hypothetical protein [uncultured Anaerovibrio sp.]